MSPTRQQILETLRGALEPLDHVHAMWLGGSAAMGASDELSDVDMVLDVADGRHLDAFAAAEASLQALAPIALRLEVIFVRDLEDLAARMAEAIEWTGHELAAVDIDAIPL